MKTDQEGVVSGEKGCKVPFKSFTVINLTPKELTECVAKWEPTDICPDQDVGKDKKIPIGKSVTINYFDAPPSLACTKLTTLVCKMGTETCEIKDIPIPPDVPSPLYIKTTLADPTKCEIAATPKHLVG